jgi:hypothetical protein
MQTQIVKMINDFEHGRLSRRQLIAHLTGMFAASLGATIAFADQQPRRTAPNPADSTTTFDATDLNHIALNVSDVQRSRPRSRCKAMHWSWSFDKRRKVQTCASGRRHFRR